MKNHKLIISSAGSGKTTFLVNTALKSNDKNVLITTYTENNEKEIRNKFIQLKGYVPKNITILSWFSFLIKHGVKPFQGILNEIMFDLDLTGLLLVSGESGIKYSFKKDGKTINVKYKEDTEFRGHYFTPKIRIYSDKLSKFVFKLSRVDKGSTFNRLSKIFDHIMIDEVQDLAGHDLELIKLMMKNCQSVTLVGDPRQVTYLTHLEPKNRSYQNGRIENFLNDKCKSLIKDGIDTKTLIHSHRCCESICYYASKLYLEFPPTISCKCCNTKPDSHQGVFLLKQKDVDNYLKIYDPIQLRWSKSTLSNPEFQSFNFGESKGSTFERVLIYPTEKMINWIKNNKIDLPNETRAKFYVGLTRAKFSAAIIFDYDESVKYDGLIKF